MSTTHDEPDTAPLAGTTAGDAEAPARAEVIRFPAADSTTGHAAGLTSDSTADRPTARASIDTPSAGAGSITAVPVGVGSIEAGSIDREVLEGEIVRVDDPAGPDRGDWLAGLTERVKDRRPVLPPWLRSRQDAKDAARWVAGHYAHVVAYHAVRVPLYAGRLAVRAPRCVWENAPVGGGNTQPPELLGILA